MDALKGAKALAIGRMAFGAAIVAAAGGFYFAQALKAAAR
jgi:hypothetical protein